MDTKTDFITYSPIVTYGEGIPTTGDDGTDIFETL